MYLNINLGGKVEEIFEQLLAKVIQMFQGIYYYNVCYIFTQ